jgi:hypothetical protein
MALPAWVERLIEPDIHSLLLQDDDDAETVAYPVVRKHWVCYIVPALLVAGGLCCWLLLVPFTSVRFGWAPILLGLALIVAGGVRGLQRSIDRFVITDQKVFRVYGLFNRRHASMPLGRILDTTVYKPLHGRILNFGHFTFESAAQDQGLKEVRYVQDIDERNLTIQRVTRDAGLRGPKARR